MRQLASARLRRTPGRYLACGLAVALAVSFAVLVQLAGTTLGQVLRTADTASVAGADVAVAASWGEPGAAEALDRVEALPEVAAVHRAGTTVLGAEIPRAAGEPAVFVAGAPPEGLRWPALLDGRWPERPDEVTVSDGALVGEEVVLIGDAEIDETGEEVAPGERLTLRVVGVVDVGLASDLPLTTFFVDPGLGLGLGAGQGELLVAGVSGTDPDALRTAVAAAVGPEGSTPLGEVLSAQQLQDGRAAASAGVVLALRTAVGAFVALAVAVAVVVVSTTYSVLLAQRVREQALLRCLGATRRGLWRAGTLEAVGLGVVAGLVGLLAGWGLAVLAWALAGDRVPGGLAVPVPGVAEVLGAPALGAVAAVVASVTALARAGQVSPLAALRPVEAVPETARSSRLRTLAGALLVLTGGAGTVVGALAGRVVVSLPAAVLAFVGVLLLGRLLLPAVARLLAAGARVVGGPAGALAAASVGRYPRRTAATASAVLIGVTLAVTAAVGAASMQASVTAELEGYTPVDVAVTTDLDDAGTAALLTDLADVDDLARAGTADVVGVGVQHPADGATSTTSTSWTQAYAGRVDTVVPTADVPPDAGTVVLSPGFAEGLEVGTGAVVTVLGSDPTGGEAAGSTHVVLVDPDTPLDVQLSQGSAAGLGAEPVVLVALAEGLDRERVAAAVDAVTATVRTADPEAVVDSPALMLAQVQRTFDVLLAVTVGLLAVTVAIALVGVSNTLSLSLAERSQENALLRALGLSRARLRAMVAWEAAVLGLVGATVGLVLGTAFGVAGAWSLLGGPQDSVIAVPWPWLLGLVLVVALVALAASSWPAHRAARTTPASALAPVG